MSVTALPREAFVLLALLCISMVFLTASVSTALSEQGTPKKVRIARLEAKLQKEASFVPIDLLQNENQRRPPPAPRSNPIHMPAPKIYPPLPPPPPPCL